MKPAKRVEDSITEQQYLLTPGHLNHYGRLFGGQLMMWIDEVAGIVARRHSNSLITTAAVDNLQFKGPAYCEQVVVLIGRMTHVGRSSMEVRVDTYVEDLDGTRRSINRAYLVEVAIDSEGKPVEVPGLVLETEVQKAEWEGAEKRKQLRVERRKEGY
ncbi:acyl-CoA thioesterase [Hominifimenecus sp. rT4P-3]|uniref:acyl-CoA thioesterase n=1 Tax=Hominifimenecus sp. rT4P-3 TaxID=3242979 RepID=UPI003DA5ECD6